MQQLEIPQISLARYFDLLRRRKWQVIPVSLLGLFIGGLIAFFIPRYYVAETRLHYYPAPGEVVRESRLQDPFLSVVNTAILTIPLEIRETMRKLGWEEATVRDEALRQDFERDVRSRLNVQDVNPGAERNYAQLVVRYRDRDGVRSAEFLNALVKLWQEKQLRRLRENADQAMKAANERVRLAISAWTDINQQRTTLAKRYGFPLELGQVGIVELARGQEAALQAQRAQLTELKAEEQVLIAEIERAQKTLDGTPRKAALGPAEMAKRLEGTPLQFAYLQMLQLRRSLEGMGPAHPNRDATMRTLARLEAAMDEFLDSQADGANPKLAELRQQIATRQAELTRAQAKRELLEERLRKDAEELLARTEAFAMVQAYDQQLAEAAEAREQAQANRDEQHAIQTQLDNRVPIDVINPATIPPAPTEPNIMLVAVLGCVVGLGVAIALILLLDLLQGTIKTLDDAERALPVPVLGGVSYIETEEQRAHATSGRRRTAMTAAALLFCGVVVVTFYYVAPDRLPSFARDLLTMVLGN